MTYNKNDYELFYFGIHLTFVGRKYHSLSFIYFGYCCSFDYVDCFKLMKNYFEFIGEYIELIANP